MRGGAAGTAGAGPRAGPKYPEFELTTHLILFYFILFFFPFLSFFKVKVSKVLVLKKNTDVDGVSGAYTINFHGVIWRLSGQPVL